MRDALGFIETEGLIAAIEAADTMIKSANVRLLKKQYVGKGLVSIIVEGDVGAVNAAVEAGACAVKSLGAKLHSTNVIPSPVEELCIFFEEETDNKTDENTVNENLDIYKDKETELPEDVNSQAEIFISDTAAKNGSYEPAVDEDTKTGEDKELPEAAVYKAEEIKEEIKLEIYSKEDIDNLMKENKKDHCIEVLKSMTNKKLKSIALEYESDKELKTKINKYNKKDLVDFIISNY